MEGLLKHAAALLQHVVGSVIDSAPHAQVWPPFPQQKPNMHAASLTCEQ